MIITIWSPTNKHKKTHEPQKLIRGTQTEKQQEHQDDESNEYESK